MPASTPIPHLLILALTGFGGAVAASPWDAVKVIRPADSRALESIAAHERSDVLHLQSPQSPGILVRMRSRQMLFFAGLDRYGAEPPSMFWVNTRSGARGVPRGSSVDGAELSESWILLSFQSARGWEKFDAPWFLSLDRRPRRIALSAAGLRLEFDAPDSGYIFSMPLFGYRKLPQRDFDFAALHRLPHAGHRPWLWRTSLPADIIARCSWWNRVAKSFPAGFDESFRVEPAADEITFRQRFQWLTIDDDWQTRPLRFVPLPPPVALAWKYPGFPMRISVPVHDPDYFTAFGPLAGAMDVDSIDISMNVLRYVHEFEWLLLPPNLSPPQREALSRIVAGIAAKFPADSAYRPDHGSWDNFAWALAGDVWYPRALPFLSGAAKARAAAGLRSYFRERVLRPHSPYHGKFLLHGPGIGSWGERGDAGKFMTTALQTVWAYAQFTGDWELIRERWPLIRRFFNTPDEADWLSFGRYAIAEIGDEAAPCAAFARMAWTVGDREAYLLGAYMFARELVHLYAKQRGGAYFFGRQPFQSLSPMPEHIYPTNLWGSTRGWQIDGPVFGAGEHQSANRWVRFQDPEVGRFYRDFLAADVRAELSWCARAGATGQPPVYAPERFREWLTRDQPHIMPSLFRLQSLLLDRVDPPYAELPAPTGWGAADIAVGYAGLRLIAPRTYWRVVPRGTPASPFVPGLQREAEGSSPTMVQDVREDGLTLEPRWHGWDMPRNPSGTPDGAYRSFGRIEGDFPGQVAGRQESTWISYGARLFSASAIVPRPLPMPAASIAREQDFTPVAVIGPFSNAGDDELTAAAYPPETNAGLTATHPGLQGPVVWRRTRLQSGRHADLSNELRSPVAAGGIAYVQQYIWAPRAVEGYVLVGHQGGVIAWVNGQRVASFHGVHRPSGDDALRAAAALRQGWNRLLLKFESWTGNYSVQFRFVHLDRLPVPGLRFSDGPNESQ